MGDGTKMSETWWGQRWNRLLESFGWGSRLARGRSYARAGRVLDCRTAPGLVTARVQGSKAKPYQVAIKIRTFSASEWERVIEALAGRTVSAARLLSGKVPPDIKDAFQEAALSLFAVQSRDIKSSCSCPDVVNPCKHVAAVYCSLGRRFDADPFLLFQLRGMEREELLTALQRGAGPEHPPQRRVGAAQPDQGGPGSNGSPPEDRPDDADHGNSPLPVDPGLFWYPGPGLSRLEMPIAPPRADAAVLRRLGPLPGWWNRVDPQEWLAECYRTVCERALADLEGP